MSRVAILYSHQGWTDILNCLALIDYYLSMNKWALLYVFIREDAKDIIDFYRRGKKVIPKYLRPSASLVQLDRMNVVGYAEQVMKIKNYDILVHGLSDHMRTDNYKGQYLIKNNTCFFVKSFYAAYDIPYSVRVESFTFQRDSTLEDKAYDAFVEKHGKDYVLTHEIQDIQTALTEPIPIVNLNGTSSSFFDSIKILEHAKELHLLDSVWGCFVYLLDAKYGLFRNKSVHIYCKRGYRQMFTEPVHLENWNFFSV